MTYADAIASLYPGVQWTIQDNDLATLQWPEGQARPTEAALQAFIAANEYREKRRLEYPPLVDLADALVHQANGDPAIYTEYVAKCNAVKARYPKP